MLYRVKSTHDYLTRYLEGELRKRGWNQRTLERAPLGARANSMADEVAYPHASRLGRLTHRPQH
jgi:hypothetical protein